MDYTVVKRCIYDYFQANNIHIRDSLLNDDSIKTDPTDIICEIFRDNFYWFDVESVGKISHYKYLLETFSGLTDNEWSVSNIKILDYEDDENLDYDEILLNFESFDNNFQWHLTDVDSDWVSPSFFKHLDTFSQKYLMGNFKSLDTHDQTVKYLYLPNHTIQVIDELFKTKEYAQALCSVGKAEYLINIYQDSEKYGYTLREICCYFSADLGKCHIGDENYELYATKKPEKDEKTDPNIEINRQYLEHVRKGCLDSVINDLKNGADINFKEKYGYSPIELAFNENHHHIEKYLIEHGADLNLYGFTSPLATAALRLTDTDKVKYLLRHKADPNIYHNSASILTHACYNYDKKLDEYVPLSHKQLEIVEILLEAGAKPNGEKDDIPDTPIKAPILTNDIQTVKLLLKYGSKLTRRSVMEAADYCEQQGNDEMLSILLQHGLKLRNRKS